YTAGAPAASFGLPLSWAAAGNWMDNAHATAATKSAAANRRAEVMGWLLVGRFTPCTTARGCGRGFPHCLSSPINRPVPTAGAGAAPWYAAVAGCCLAVAVVTGGFWLRRRRSLRGVRRRVAALVLAGCASVGWASGWLWAHAGREGPHPVGGVWNLAVDLPR